MWTFRDIVLKWIPSIGFLAFLVERGMFFVEEWAAATKDYEDDVFTAHLCKDNNIKANLGKNVHICEQARINLQISPWQAALKKVVENTHLCGDMSCVYYINDIVDSMTSSLNRLLFLALSIIVSIHLMMYMWKQMSLARAKRKVCALPTHADDFKVLTNINYKLD